MSRDTNPKKYIKIFLGTFLTLGALTLILVVFLAVAEASKNETSSNTNNGESFFSTVSETFSKINIVNANKKLKDKEPPVIHGVSDIYITEGDTVSYKSGVFTTDNSEEEVTLEINPGNADTNTPGDYLITYTATDSTGNSSKAYCTLHVAERPTIVTNDKAIRQLAKEILSEITTTSMSSYEKVQAIFKYTCGITYSNYRSCYENNVLQYNWIEAANMGIEDRKGDCFAYAATAHVLLEEAGFTDIIIEAEPLNNRHHFFNLFNTGNGWYYLDATMASANREDIIFFTQEELDSWDQKYYNNRHKYDTSKYEVTPVDKKTDKTTGQ